MRRPCRSSPEQPDMTSQPRKISLRLPNLDISFGTAHDGAPYRRLTKHIVLVRKHGTRPAGAGPSNSGADRMGAAVAHPPAVSIALLP